MYLNYRNLYASMRGCHVLHLAAPGNGPDVFLVLAVIRLQKSADLRVAHEETTSARGKCENLPIPI